VGQAGVGSCSYRLAPLAYSFTTNPEPTPSALLSRPAKCSWASGLASDKKVAGVVSGAGSYGPGIILDKQNSQDCRGLVALVGKVYRTVDAQYSPGDVGDLLTTPPSGVMQ
jgi:hypothetical protein